LTARRAVARRYWLLGKPGILRLIAILYENGAMPLHHIPRYGMGVGTTYRSASDAAKLGLVELYYCGSSKCARLTAAGAKLGERLHLLLRALEEVGLAEPLPGDGAPREARRETPEHGV